MFGRDVSPSPERGKVIRGDAAVTVDLDTPAIEADVEFTNVIQLESGAPVTVRPSLPGLLC